MLRCFHKLAKYLQSITITIAELENPQSRGLELDCNVRSFDKRVRGVYALKMLLSLLTYETDAIQTKSANTHFNENAEKKLVIASVISVKTKLHQ